MTHVLRCGRPILFCVMAFTTVWIGMPGLQASRSSIIVAGLLGTVALSMRYFTRPIRLAPVRVTSASPLSAPDARDLDRFDFERLGVQKVCRALSACGSLSRRFR